MTLARVPLAANISWERMIRAVEKVRERMLRATNALERAGLPYAVVYGSGEARTAAALAALRPLLGLPVAAGATAGTPGDAAPAADETMPRWLSRCRECLVPGCEHLQRLLPSPPRHHDRS